MRITQAVNGRFHSFDVANELARRGHLRCLITSYPKFVASRFGIPRNLVRAVPALEAVKRALIYGGLPGQALSPAFDRIVEFLLPKDTQILETWSGSSLRSIHRAHELGAITMLKRSSAHILTQNQLLVDEAERWGVSTKPIPDFVIEQELAEYDQTDFVLASSSFIARTFRERGFPAERVLSLPLGVDTSQFCPSDERHAGFRVVFCGSAGLRKGVPDLLEAFAALELKDAELWLVGGIEPDLEPVLSRFSHACVRRVGRVPYQKMREIYNQCDVLCLPSIEDGFGNVVAQAMACGLPVIVTSNVGASDCVDESTGRVVSIRDVDALKAAILELYEDREQLAEMGGAAARKMRSGWTWSDYADRLLDTYESTLQQSSSSKPGERSPRALLCEHSRN